MNLRTTFVLFVALLPAIPGHAGDILDRIVATVNGSIILQSDWEDAIRYEAFMSKRPAAAITAGDRKAALDHLIDQELLRQQMRPSEAAQPSPQEIDSQVAEVRKLYFDVHTDEPWRSLLAANRLTEAELRRRLALQLELTRLVDAHLRPAAIVSSKSIESYYQQELLPQLRQSGTKDVPLDTVSAKIREILTQRQISEMLVAWLHDLRSGGQILIRADSAPDGSVAQ